MANEHGFVFCATDWTGMSTLDVPNVLALLQDLSRFPTLADRAQQGFVNFMYVGRWMLKRDWGDLDVDQSRLFYDGNSQGGIMGGALTALAPDFDRAVLGVPGMNYSTLLRRSVDFDTLRPRQHRGRATRRSASTTPTRTSSSARCSCR